MAMPLAKVAKREYLPFSCAAEFRMVNTRAIAAPSEVCVMKKEIHPKVFNATVTCACGNEASVLSTKGEKVHVEVCSACHPFFTGKQRFLDTAGRIDRFRKKYSKFEQK